MRWSNSGKVLCEENKIADTVYSNKSQKSTTGVKAQHKLDEGENPKALRARHAKTLGKIMPVLERPVSKAPQVTGFTKIRTQWTFG